MSSMPRILSLFASVALLSCMTAETQAQIVKPIKISGSGISPQGIPLPGNASPHWIVGEATHLGRHYGAGTVKTLSAEFNFEAGTITGRFGSGSPFIFTGANGDQIACDYGDQGNGEFGIFELTILGDTPEGLLVEAYWIADFVVKPEMSTGKFAGTTGSWVMTARSEPFVLGTEDPVAYSWEGEGKLTFKRPSR